MSSDSKCQYCGATGEHEPHCPTKDANPEWAKKEWQKGLDRGWADEFISHHVLARFSRYFQRGYKKGRDKIQECVEIASEFRASGGYEY